MDLMEFSLAKQYSAGCKVCGLPKSLREELDAGLRSGIPSTHVEQWLKAEHNVVIGESSIRRHRRHLDES